VPKGVQLSSADFSTLRSGSDIPEQYQNKKHSNDATRRNRQLSTLEEVLDEIVLRLKTVLMLKGTTYRKNCKKSSRREKDFDRR
jgi:hypothetical protein